MPPCYQCRNEPPSGCGHLGTAAPPAARRCPAHRARGLLREPRLGAARLGPRRLARPREREPLPLRPRLRCARRLLPRLRAGLDVDPQRVGDPADLSGRAAGGDALDAREVHPGRDLGAGRSRCGRPPCRRDRRGARHVVDAARGRALGGGGRDRLRRQPAVRRQRARTARAARGLRRGARDPRPAARLPAPRGLGAAQVRLHEGAAGHERADDLRAAPLLRRHLDPRRLRALAAAALGRRASGGLVDRLPRRHGCGRRDRGRPLRLRAVGTRPA